MLGVVGVVIGRSACRLLQHYCWWWLDDVWWLIHRWVGFKLHRVEHHRVELERVNVQRVRDDGGYFGHSGLHGGAPDG